MGPAPKVSLQESVWVQMPQVEQSETRQGAGQVSVLGRSLLAGPFEQVWLTGMGLQRPMTAVAKLPW